jgi:hypothetical protein
MGRGVTVCDWSKQVIDPNEELKSLTIEGTEYVFSVEGYEAMLNYLNSNEVAATTSHPQQTIRQPGTTEAAPQPAQDITKPLPVPSREEQDRILEESRRAEEFTLPTISDPSEKAAAQRRLDELNGRVEQGFKKEHGSKEFQIDWNPRKKTP